MKEIWKDIVGYIGSYMISNYGNTKRLAGSYKCKNERILKPKKNKSGHLRITLHKNDKPNYCYIHRLVLETFVGPCPIGMECRHLDGDPGNNKLENLKWGTRIENSQDSKDHHGHYIHNIKIKDKLKLEQVKILIKEDKLTQREIGELVGVCQPVISNIKNNKTQAYKEEING